MAAGLNRCLIMGNVGADPNVKQLDGGITVATFSVATTEQFRDKSTGEKREDTTWHQVVCWRGVAESVQKSELRKGDRVYVEGKMKTRKFNDKNGNEKRITEIVCDNFTIINRKKRDDVNATASEEEPEEEL